MKESTPEQKLVDICFMIALTMKGNKKLNKMSNEDLAKWVADQLNGCGFKTFPCGSSWGVLEKKN